MLANDLRHDPDRFHEIAVIGENTGNVVVVLKSVKEQMACKIHIAPFLFNLDNFHNVRPGFRECGGRAKLRRFYQPRVFL